MGKQLYCFLILFTTSFSSIWAQTIYTSVQDGKWESANTWSPSGVPGAGDQVIIRGYTVDIDDATGDVSIGSLQLDNDGAGSASTLEVNGQRTLNVSGNIEGYLDNTYHDVYLKLKGQSIVQVGGDLIFEREASNNNSEKLQLYMADSSRMNITGNFTYSYYDSGILEFSTEVYTDDYSRLTVGTDLYLNLHDGIGVTLETHKYSSIRINGNTHLTQTGGGTLSYQVEEESEINTIGNLNAVITGGYQLKLRSYDTGMLAVGGTLSLNSQDADDLVSLKAYTSGVIDVDGNIELIAQSESDTYIALANSSELRIGGNFIRSTGYGRLDMDDTATLIMDGTQAQSIPAEDIAGNGTDKFDVTNIELDNAAGFALEDTMCITQHLSLDAGIIVTDANKPLVIANGATSDVGSANAYVDGPMIKQGSTGGSSFIFPLGDQGVYAPIEISEITASEDQFLAQYFADPPPIDEGHSSSMSQMSKDEYWTISRLAGSTPVGVTLHWTDNVASGISDPSNLLVAYQDNSTTGWESLGNGGTTVDGNGGTVAAADPPPIEDGQFTFGSTVSSSSSVLPVELVHFRAGEEGGEVLLEWETASEENSSHFTVERSTDGRQFEPVARRDASGVNTRSPQYYEALDEHPAVGLNYYRLKMVDLDGTYAYSNIQAVEIKVMAEAMLFPNPVFDILYVRYGEQADEEVIIEIFNQQGQLLYRGQQQIMDGETMISATKMNVSAPGTYILNIHGAAGSQSLRFVKSH